MLFEDLSYANILLFSESLLPHISFSGAIRVHYLKETYTLDHKQPNEQSLTSALSEKLQHVFKVSQ